jgi:hypothetical protein
MWLSVLVGLRVAALTKISPKPKERREREREKEMEREGGLESREKRKHHTRMPHLQTSA